MMSVPVIAATALEICVPIASARASATCVFVANGVVAAYSLGWMGDASGLYALFQEAPGGATAKVRADHPEWIYRINPDNRNPWTFFSGDLIASNYFLMPPHGKPFGAFLHDANGVNHSGVCVIGGDVDPGGDAHGDGDGADRSGQ